MVYVLYSCTINHFPGSCLLSEEIILQSSAGSCCFDYYEYFVVISKLFELSTSYILRKFENVINSTGLSNICDN